MKDMKRLKSLVAEISSLLEGMDEEMPTQFAEADDQGEEHDGEEATEGVEEGQVAMKSSEDADMKKKLMVAKLKKMVG